MTIFEARWRLSFTSIVAGIIGAGAPTLRDDGPCGASNAARIEGGAVTHQIAVERQPMVSSGTGTAPLPNEASLVPRSATLEP
jgi:hypothetical protein